MSVSLKFSVVVCTYSTERIDDLVQALDSISKQTYRNVQTVVVVDGNEEVYSFLIKHMATHYCSPMECHLNETNLGLSKSRNIGANLASGDVVVFMDDDAIADPDWIEQLNHLYTDYNAVAAGGKLKPLWVCGKADFIPDEFLWLVGSNPNLGDEHFKIVRNTYGSNISFWRAIFLRVGGFGTKFGFNAGKGGVMQGEEADLCNRVRNLTGDGVWYSPYAIVYHKVFPSRVELKTLFRRAFWQGYSKRMMKETSSESLGDESGFLKYILFTGIPKRIVGLVSMQPWMNLKQLFFLIAFTGAVGLGYVYRACERNKFIEDDRSFVDGTRLIP